MGDFILKIPIIDGTNYFTKELLEFFIIIFAVIAGVLICFWGYKYFQTLFVILFGLASGYIGVQLMIFLTKQLIIQMYIFVIFTFLGCCLLYFISILFNYLLKILQIKKLIEKKMYIITSFLGAFFTSLITYHCIYHKANVIFCVFMFLLIVGSICQNRNQRKRPIFHTYEDIYKMKLAPEEDNKNA